MQVAAVRARRIAATAVSVRESGYATSAAPDVPELAELGRGCWARSASRLRWRGSNETEQRACPNLEVAWSFSGPQFENDWFRVTVNHRAHFFTLIKTVCADLKLSEFTVIQHRSYVVLHNLYIELCIWCLAKEKSGFLYWGRIVVCLALIQDQHWPVMLLWCRRSALYQVRFVVSQTWLTHHSISY